MTASTAREHVNKVWEKEGRPEIKAPGYMFKALLSPSLQTHADTFTYMSLVGLKVNPDFQLHVRFEVYSPRSACTA